MCLPASFVASNSRRIRCDTDEVKPTRVRRKSNDNPTNIPARIRRESDAHPTNRHENNRNPTRVRRVGTDAWWSAHAAPRQARATISSASVITKTKKGLGQAFQTPLLVILSASDRFCCLRIFVWRAKVSFCSTSDTFCGLRVSVRHAKVSLCSTSDTFC